MISVTNTNPTPATDGTELNPFIMDRSNQEQLYVSLPAIRPLSLRKSPSTTTDSSTIYSGSDKSHPTHRRSTTSVSETSVSSGSESPSVSDFEDRLSQGKGPVQQAPHPTSRATAQAEHITSDPPPWRYRSAHIGDILTARKSVDAGEFYFPRPSDDEVEQLFRKIKRSFGLGDHMLNMTVDQKWQMVHNAEYLRWSEELRREQQTKKPAGTGQSVSFVQGSPEWYMQRFMVRTITQKEVTSLEVSLRTNELRSTLPQHLLPSITKGFF